MSAISDELALVKTNLDATTASLTNIATGVLALDAMIQAFQNSPGTLNAADQAALDAISTESTALAAQAAAVNTTPPSPPAPTT